MLMVYLCIVGVLLFIQYIYNKQYVTILVGIFFILFLELPNLEELKYSVVSLVQKIYSNETIIVFTIIISLLYLISELFIVLGFQRDFLHFLNKKSKKSQKVYMHLLGLLSTNIDNTDLMMDDENQAIHNSSAFIVSTLNVFSVPFLTSLFMITSVFSNLFDVATIFLVIMTTNFFALFWFIKRIIDIKKNAKIEYRYYQERLIQKNSVSEHQNYKYGGQKWMLLRILLYVIIAFGSIFLIDKAEYSIIGFLILVFADLFISSEFFVFKKKNIDEKLIYILIFNGFKKIFSDIIVIILGMMFVITASDILLKFGDFSYLENIGLFGLLIFVAGLITFRTRHYTLGIVLTIPVLYLIVNSFVLQNSGQIAVVFFLAAIYISQHLSILKIDVKKRSTIIDFGFQLLVVIICYISFALFYNVFYTLILLSILLLIYATYIIKKI